MEFHKIKNIKIIGLIFLSFTTNFLNAQLPPIKWQYDLNDASFGQSAAADIDNDGKPEILHGGFDGKVICINAEKWLCSLATDCLLKFLGTNCPHHPRC